MITFRISAFSESQVSIFSGCEDQYPALTDGAAPKDGDISESELALYAELLEAMYSRDGKAALDKLEDITYFLHRNRIEAPDYTEQNREWFDVMPSTSAATIRPALVRDGKLLKKGLAAGGK